MRRRLLALLSCLTAALGAAVVVAVPAYALGPGRACVFLQPDGAPFLGANRGHVGWAYLIGGTDRYVFGATENPTGAYEIPAGGDAGGWTAQGTWSQLLAGFTDQPYWPALPGGPARPVHAYRTYRCHDTPTSAVGAANTAVDQVRAAGYRGTGNNCMNHAYRVLSAYGTPDLPNPDLVWNWEPRNWYANLTTGWWEGSLGG